jgi:hypothetical protein
MKKLSEGFAESFPVPSYCCLPPSDYGTLKGHCPICRCFRDDRLEGVARRAGRFRRHQGAHQALAQQMGYVPDSTAQGLRTRTTKLFGLVIPSITNPIYARIVFALEERAHELGYDILLAHTHNIPEREETCIRRLLSRRVDGLFISPVYRFEAEARIYQEWLARQTPTILLGPPAPFCKLFPSVEIEELDRQLRRHATPVETRPQTHRLSHRPAIRAVGA